MGLDLREEHVKLAEDATATDTSTHMEVFDARHLASLNIVRARLVKLLQGSENHMHVAQNIMLTLVRLHNISD
jgi:hypothetical protein